MSINTMANAAAARRADIGVANTVPRGLDEIALASRTTPVATTTGHGKPAATTAAAPIETAFNVLFGYIPTEVLTLYVAVTAAVQPVQQTGQVTTAAWITFITFLIATPIVVWLVFGGKLMAAKKAVPTAFKHWPVWEMFAASVAFCAWAFALPNSPFSEFKDWYSSALAGVAVLVASTVLGLLAPFFQRSLGADAHQNL